MGHFLPHFFFSIPNRTLSVCMYTHTHSWIHQVLLIGAHALALMWVLRQLDMLLKREKLHIFYPICQWSSSSIGKSKYWWTLKNLQFLSNIGRRLMTQMLSWPYVNYIYSTHDGLWKLHPNSCWIYLFQNKSRQILCVRWEQLCFADVGASMGQTFLSAVWSLCFSVELQHATILFFTA